MSAFVDGLKKHNLSGIDARVTLLADGRVAVVMHDCEQMDMRAHHGDSSITITLTADDAEELGYVLSMAAQRIRGAQ